VFERRLLIGTAARYKADLREVHNEGLYWATIIIIVIVIMVLHLCVGPWPWQGQQYNTASPPPRAEK
jgi:hypothetical protein